MKSSLLIMSLLAVICPGLPAFGCPSEAGTVSAGSCNFRVALPDRGPVDRAAVTWGVMAYKEKCGLTEADVVDIAELVSRKMQVAAFSRERFDELNASRKKSVCGVFKLEKRGRWIGYLRPAEEWSGFGIIGHCRRRDCP